MVPLVPQGIAIWVRSFLCLPLGKFVGISVMAPCAPSPRIDHHPDIITDASPRERWGFDMIEAIGEAKLRRMVTEIKEMPLTINANSECCSLLFHCPFS